MSLSQELRLQLKENPGILFKSSWFLFLTLPVTSVGSVGRCSSSVSPATRQCYEKLFVEAIMCRELSVLKTFTAAMFKNTEAFFAYSPSLALLKDTFSVSLNTSRFLLLPIAL